MYNPEDIVGVPESNEQAPALPPYNQLTGTKLRNGSMELISKHIASRKYKVPVNKEIPYYTCSGDSLCRDCVLNSFNMLLFK